MTFFADSASNQGLKLKRRMIDFLQIHQQLFGGHCISLICDLVDQIRHAELLSALFEFIPKDLFKLFGHPYQAFEAALCEYEFLANSIKLADIQAPSTVTKEGKAAQKYALSLLKNKMVYLDINDNTTGTRNEWSQLICVIYLMDSELRPVWPPVNRILVDGGYARLNDDVNNEFNSSAWWQQPPVFPPGEKRDRLLAMLEKRPLPEQETLVGPSSSPAGVIMGSFKKGSILEKDSASGRISIGYRT